MNEWITAEKTVSPAIDHSQHTQQLSYSGKTSWLKFGRMEKPICTRPWRS